MATKALSRPVIIQMPRRAPGRLRRAGRRVGHAARRAGRGIRRGASAVGVAPMALLLGGAAAGWAEQKGYLKKLPQVGGSAAVSMVIAGYATQRFLGGKHRAFKAAGLAMMVAGAFDFGRVQAGGTSGLDETSEFDERHL